MEKGYRRRRIIHPRLVVIVLVVGMISAVPIVFGLFVLGMGSGSPRTARQWKETFEDIPDPETARARYPQVAVKRYENGEWIFGIGKDSHGSPFRGGTIVVKDSHGRIRAFFGHVCGDGMLQWAMDRSKSLGDFYQSIQNEAFLRACNLHEYTFRNPD